jgi:hypothetical protein
MYKVILMVLLAVVSSGTLTRPAMADGQSDAKIAYSNARQHLSKTLFFEQIENGVIGRYVALRFFAGEEQDGTKWANCEYIGIYINKETKLSELYMEHYSTDDNSITNLSISPKSVSFDINTGWFDQGGHTRQLSFVATRQGSISSTYQANGVGLWKNMFDETKIIKVEWKQVPSIALPYPLSN